MAETIYFIEQKQIHNKVGEHFLFISNHVNLFLLGNSNHNTSAAVINNAPALTIKTPVKMELRLSSCMNSIVRKIILLFLVKEIIIDLPGWLKHVIPQLISYTEVKL